MINSKRRDDRVTEYFSPIFLILREDTLDTRQSENASSSTRYKYPLRGPGSASIDILLRARRQSRGTTPRRWKRSRKTFIGAIVGATTRGYRRLRVCARAEAIGREVRGEGVRERPAKEQARTRLRDRWSWKSKPIQNKVKTIENFHRNRGLFAIIIIRFER